MKTALLTVLAAAVLAGPAAAAPAPATWFWSPAKMEDALRATHFTLPKNTIVDGIYCSGYGVSTYTENDSQIYNRFRCLIDTLSDPHGKFQSVLGMNIPQSPEQSTGHRYQLTTRATSRFTFVATSAAVRIH